MIDKIKALLSTERNFFTCYWKQYSYYFLHYFIFIISKTTFNIHSLQWFI